MGLPWVRLDSSIATHDKVIAARTQPGGKQAMCLYMFALAWSGGAGTDGHIPPTIAKYLGGTPKEIAVLEQVGLWDRNGDGWNIRNYAQRQEIAEISDAKREQAAAAGRKSGCRRKGHPDGCTCWLQP